MEFEGLDLFFLGCFPPSSPTPWSRRLLKALRAGGGLFLKKKAGAQNVPEWEIDFDPAASIQSDGAFMGLEFAHEALRRSPLALPALAAFPPTATVSFFPDSRSAQFTQTAWGDSAKRLDALARGQLALGSFLYSRVSPAFGFIDENSPSAVFS
jgi:hypothetical protein